MADATRERITDVAAAAIREAPVSALTVADVATAAGVTNSAIYKAYANKYELFAEASRRVMVTQLTEVAESVDESTQPIDRLRHVLTEILRTVAAEPFAVAYLYGMFPLLHHGDVDTSVRDQIADVEEHIRSRLAHRVDDAITAGDLTGDRDVVVDLCRVAIFGYIGIAVHQAPTIAPDVYVDFVLSGLDTRPFDR